MAALSPEIVESIAEGRQPPDLTLQMLLTRRIHLPLDWAAQQRALGIGKVAAHPARVSLAPAIVEQIVEGRQPPELTAQALRTGHLELPPDWEAQSRTFEFARPA